jgi:hypothetical protein
LADNDEDSADNTSDSDNGSDDENDYDAAISSEAACANIKAKMVELLQVCMIITNKFNSKILGPKTNPGHSGERQV